MSSSKAPGSVRPLPVVAAILLAMIGLAVAGAILFGAFVGAPSSAAAEAGVVYGLTFDRAWITVVDLLALGGAAIGVLTLARSSRGIDTGRKAAVAAVAAGLLGVIGGVLNLALADAGPGSGNGVIGGVLALLLGLTATVLGTLTLTRSRRAD